MAKAPMFAKGDRVIVPNSSEYEANSSLLARVRSGRAPEEVETVLSQEYIESLGTWVVALTKDGTLCSGTIPQEGLEKVYG